MDGNIIRQNERLQPQHLETEDDDLLGSQNQAPISLTRQLLENRQNSAREQQQFADEDEDGEDEDEQDLINEEGNLGLEGATDPMLNSNNNVSNSRGDIDPRQMNEIEYQQMLQRIGLQA